LSNIAGVISLITLKSGGFPRDSALQLSLAGGKNIARAEKLHIID
jgi:hypothetical protein